MALTKLDLPTLKELFERTRDDYDTRLPGEGARIRRSFLYVTSAVLSGAVHGLYKLADRVAANILVDKADDEEIILRHAAIRGILRDPGTAATGSVVFSGTPATNIPAATEIERDDGTTYTTDALATVGGGGDVTVAVTATEPGEAANIEDEDEELSLKNPITGISSTVTVATGQAPSGGVDEESLESLRARTIDRIRDTPQGGAAADYVERVKSAPDVSEDVARVWVGQEGGAGSVTVWFALEGTGSDVIPTSADVTAVGNYIDEIDDDAHSVWRPVTANVSVGAPVAYTVDFTIGLSPYNSTTAALVEAELEAMFSTESNVKRTGFASPVIKNAKIHEALSRTMVQGVDFYTLNAVDGGAGTDDIEPDSVGELPILGSISWIAL